MRSLCRKQKEREQSTTASLEHEGKHIFSAKNAFFPSCAFALQNANERKHPRISMELLTSR